MFDEKALSLIQQTAIDAQGRRVPDGIDAVALPGNYDLHNVEPYRLRRARFRGALTTNNFDSFVDYSRGHGRAECYVDAEKFTARTFFNLGTEELPGHGDWHATLTLPPTAAYTALCGIHAQRCDQRALTDWIEDWADHVRPINEDGGTYGQLSKAVSAVRAITIKATSESETKQTNFAESRSAFDQVEASSKLELPYGFEFRCVPYLGLPERTFVLRLGVLTSAKDPTLVLRVVQLEAAREAIAADFARVLTEKLGDAIAVTIGNFKP